jgi:hypothetical protein
VIALGTVTLTLEEYNALLEAAGAMGSSSPTTSVVAPGAKPKRKVSAYNRRYSAAYKSLRRKATLKNGTLRKGVTHKKLVKAAHAKAKKGGKK